jgi:hypothetical protein
MSHRSALFTSVALTLLLALGILAARDRLFEAKASPGDNAPARATSVADATTLDTIGGTRPVIEVTLPQPNAAPLGDARSGDDDQDEHDDRDDEDEDEENEDDEEDGHEDD